MNLSIQITVYATFLAATLTLMRIIKGISGSRPVSRWLFLTAIICATALFIASLASALINLEIMKLFYSNNTTLCTSLSTIWFLLWLMAVFYTFGFGVLIRIYVRNLRFQDKGTIENIKITPPFRWIRKKRREKDGDRKDYEVTDPKRGNCNIEILQKYLDNRKEVIRPHLITGPDPWFARMKIVQMCVELIKMTDENINYVTVITTPTEIWSLFEIQAKVQGVDINKIKKRIVFIDAFEKIFGFKDDIVEESRRKLKNNHIDIVTCDSAAGIHSGTSEAFKILKKNATEDRNTRQPCTMIYDSLSALAIAETENEVSEFILHLSAAETAYDMICILFESNLDKRSSEIINTMFSCCGRYIEYSDT